LRCGFFYGDRFNVVNDEDHMNTYTSFQTELSNGMSFDFDYLTSSIDVNDNFQSPSYPALSFATPANAVLPGKGGSPFPFAVMFIGRALGSAFDSPPAPRSLESERFSLGLSGELDNGFDFSASLTVSSEENAGDQPDTSTARFGNAINGIGGAPGIWNLFNPTENSQALIDYISTTQFTKYDTKLSVLDIVLTGSVNDVEIATGFQFRKEEYDVTRNEDSIATFDESGALLSFADLIFLGSGFECASDRSAYAVFVEAAKQATDRLELRGALRAENLDTDSTINPKVSMRFEANENLVLRGSVSTSFREASLSQLNNSQVGLQGIQDFDSSGSPVGQASFIRVAQALSKDLKPEESTNLNFGAVWTPTDDISVKLDYWSIDYEDVITIESAQGKVIANPTGPDILRLTDGTLIGITSKYKNASEVNTDGYDIEATYRIDSNIGLVNLGINRPRTSLIPPPAAGISYESICALFIPRFTRPIFESILYVASISYPSVFTSDAFLYFEVIPIRVPSVSLNMSGPVGFAITLPCALSIVMTSS
jgi:iron complex outermembrane receptor protein